jgi:hypothetical protein
LDIIHEKIYKLMQHQGKVERNKFILSSNNILGFGFWNFQNNACEGRTYLFLGGRMITQVSLREATTLLLKKGIWWEFFFGFTYKYNSMNAFDIWTWFVIK